MGRKINIEEVRGFLEASNRQFEQGGIYLERALFKRDDNGVLTGITLSYEDRTTSDTFKRSALYIERPGRHRRH